MPVCDPLLESLPSAARRQLRDIDSRLLQLLRSADLSGQQATLRQLAAELGRDWEHLAERVKVLSRLGLVSHSSDDPDVVDEESIVEIEGDVPTVG